MQIGQAEVFQCLFPGLFLEAVLQVSVQHRLVLCAARWARRNAHQRALAVLELGWVLARAERNSVQRRLPDGSSRSLMRTLRLRTSQMKQRAFAFLRVEDSQGTAQFGSQYSQPTAPKANTAPKPAMAQLLYRTKALV